MQLGWYPQRWSATSSDLTFVLVSFACSADSFTVTPDARLSRWFRASTIGVAKEPPIPLATVIRAGQPPTTGASGCWLLAQS